MGSYELVLFDLGGVIADMDRAVIAQMVNDAGFDPMPGLLFFRSAYEPGADADHPLHRAERGEIDNSTLLALAETSVPNVARLLGIGGIVSRSLSPNADWADLARAIAARGVRTGALSNTFDGLCGAAFEVHRPDLHAHVLGLFGEDIIESHLVGMRKPDPAIFRLAAARFDVDPANVVFVDDEATNCEGARAAGMTAIHNAHGATAQAELRTLLGL